MSLLRATRSPARTISHLQTLCLNEEEMYLYEYCELGALLFQPLATSNNPWLVINKYCKSRTLYCDARYNSLLRVIPPNPPRPFMAAIFCLICPYVGRPELTYVQEVLTFLSKAIKNRMSIPEMMNFATIVRLQVQYHVVKRDLDETWAFHVKGFRALQNKTLEYAEGMLRITYESILKFALVQGDEGPNSGLSIDYLLALENPQEIRDYGCSPEVLHLLGCISTADHEIYGESARRAEAHSLLARCENTSQTIPEVGDRFEAIKTTAESYVHMARALIHWRLLNSRICTPSVVEAGNALGQCVLSIPAEGELFTAQYPLAPAFWAILFSPKYGQKCSEFLSTIWTDRPTVSRFTWPISQNRSC